MDLKAIKALTAAALLAATASASAATTPFNLVSGPVTSGVDVSLSVQATDSGYDFVVSNSSLMGIVTGVYFETNWNALLTDNGTSTGPASLISGTREPVIDGWEGTKASHTVEVQRVRLRATPRGFKDYYFDVVSDGILEGTEQTFSFNAGLGVSLEDIQSMLGTDGYGVAIRVQGLTEDEQASGWGEVGEGPEQILTVQAFRSLPTGPGGGDNGGDKVEAVSAPSPTAALAGLVVAGIAGLRRRRR